MKHPILEVPFIQKPIHIHQLYIFMCLFYSKSSICYTGWMCMTSGLCLLSLQDLAFAENPLMVSSLLGLHDDLSNIFFFKWFYSSEHWDLRAVRDQGVSLERFPHLTWAWIHLVSASLGEISSVLHGYGWVLKRFKIIFFTFLFLYSKS